MEGFCPPLPPSRFSGIFISGSGIRFSISFKNSTLVISARVPSPPFVIRMDTFFMPPVFQDTHQRAVPGPEWFTRHPGKALQSAVTKGMVFFPPLRLTVSWPLAAPLSPHGDLDLFHKRFCSPLCKLKPISTGVSCEMIPPWLSGLHTASVPPKKERPDLPAPVYLPRLYSPAPHPVRFFLTAEDAVTAFSFILARAIRIILKIHQICLSVPVQIRSLNRHFLSRSSHP